MANLFKEVGETLKGMGVTFRTMLKKPVTVQYPEQQRTLPARVRGRHVLHRYENSLERCIACMLCSGTCPADAIYIEPAENDSAKPISFGERYAKTFQIDMLRCIFCGYCQSACPTGAITLENNTALASSTREQMVYQKEQLLEAPNVSTRGAALAWETPPPAEAQPTIPAFKGVFDGWRTTAAAVGQGNLPLDVDMPDTPAPLRHDAQLIAPSARVLNFSELLGDGGQRQR